jgi:manganese transport protein
MIRVAQVANGMLLPLIAVFLVWVVNRPGVLGKYRNTILQNVLAVLIVLIAVFLGVRGIIKVISDFL